MSRTLISIFNPLFFLTVLNPLVNSLSFDTSELFKAHFLQQILTHIRSSNKTVQTNAITLLCVFAGKSRKDEVVVEIGADVMKLLSGGWFQQLVCVEKFRVEMCA